MTNYHEIYNRFYNSPEWKHLRAYVFNRANGICEECKRNGIIKAGKEVHHKKPLDKWWELRLDADNCELLCADCHNQKHERVSELQKFLTEWNKI